MLPLQPTWGGVAMNKQQFQRELDYGAAISIATSMLRRQLITPNEFRKLRAVLLKKYRPVVSSLKETSHGSPPDK